ncbi:hypothetical protein SAMN05446037_102417 [Anaerovirgula multivorans]|uniref:Uncharacterized protein n=1 Tax=Anaerovirgula multivorans TaxID=312168 RepID=A0A239HV78_9FIRM|nr:hypothetical protein SAMN05446037_102417 [Anaerovirgula multivorans]
MKCLYNTTYQNEDALMKFWKKINKKASAGVDKITAKAFQVNLQSII